MSTTQTRTTRPLRSHRLIGAAVAGVIAAALAMAGPAHADRSVPPADTTSTDRIADRPADAPTTTGDLTTAGTSEPGPGGPTGLAGLSPSGFTLDGLKVSPHGTYVRFDYTTNAPAVTVRLSTFVPKFANGVWTEPIMDSIIGPEVVDGTGKVTYAPWGLTPDTTYYYIITVPTAANQMPVQAVGSFTTLHRTLTIVWNTIHVTDDSDPGAKGDGDFTFWFRANNQAVASFSKDIASDSTYTIDVDGQGTPLSTVISDVPNTEVPIAIQVYEDDVQSWDECGAWLTGGESWDGEPINQENECGTWTAMTHTYDAGPGLYGPGYGYHEGDPVVFEMSPYKSSVHLTVSGTITATWS